MLSGVSYLLTRTASYTWSHALDIQSNLGLFFNGNNPLQPSQSYGTSTFDRTHVFNSAYSYVIPGLSRNGALVSMLTNGWTLNGIVVLQSGQPYNLIDYSGAIAGQYNSTTVNISDPILGFTPGTPLSQIKLQGTTGYNVNNLLIDTSKIYVPTVAPGTSGVPACATVNGAQVCDTYETTFAGSPRNGFRAPFQSRADLSLAKLTKFQERMSLKLQFDVFNVFNHPDFDAPNSNSSLYSVARSGNSITKVTVRAPSTSLGLIQGTLGSPRIMMVSAHFSF